MRGTRAAVGTVERGVGLRVGGSWWPWRGRRSSGGGLCGWRWWPWLIGEMEAVAECCAVVCSEAEEGPMNSRTAVRCWAFLADDAAMR
jgi:hypothetical protein